VNAEEPVTGESTAHGDPTQEDWNSTTTAFGNRAIKREQRVIEEPFTTYKVTIHSICNVSGTELGYSITTLIKAYIARHGFRLVFCMSSNDLH
jgi:hypothetical protein